MTSQFGPAHPIWLRRLLPAMLFSTCVLVPTGVVADYHKGLSAFKHKDYATALREYRLSAEQGDARAQLALGLMYGKGEGAAKDDKQADIWIRKAAEQGYVDAQSTLGSIYYNRSDNRQAAFWFRKAAEQGYADAQFKLGIMYDQGEGVAQDKTQAVSWYRKASEQGNAMAQFNLAHMYYNGDGVAQDKQQAVVWLRKAANQGLPEAKAALKKLSQ